MLAIDLGTFPWQLFLTILFFFWGACIGSYLNVCIHRIPREVSTVKPRSHCPHCKKLIPWYFNIPLLTYLCLGGKCRYCRGPIHIRYFLVEGLTALLFLMVWLKFDLELGGRPFALVPITNPWLVPIYWLFLSGLLLGTFIDFEHFIIPDRVSLGGIPIGLICSVLVPAMHQVETPFEALIASAIGAVVGWSILWLIGVLGKLAFKKDAMGFGDVKLLSAIGAFLGWKAVVFTLIGSSLVGSVVGIALVLLGKKEMQGRIPFGPYLALAATFWIFWGPLLLEMYLALIRGKPVL